MKAARWIGIGLVMIGFALVAAVYARLPDPVPMHVSWRGEPGNFVAKPWGALLPPMLSAVIYAITLAVTRRMPRLAVLPVAIAAFGLFAHVLLIRAALGEPASSRAVFAGVGALFIVIGNYLGVLRRNRWIGIRTPWTLADAEVWLRTHRVGGWAFVAAGVVTELAVVAGAPPQVMTAPLVLAALGPAVYSAILYRQLRAGGPT